jgi:hypothetical protein
VLFTYELARRQPAATITANACTPASPAHVSEPKRPHHHPATIRPVHAALHETSARGATTSIHLASAPDLRQVTGRYFANNKPRRSAKRSYDEAVAARLWQASAALTG